MALFAAAIARGWSGQPDAATRTASARSARGISSACSTSSWWHKGTGGGGSPASPGGLEHGRRSALMMAASPDSGPRPTHHAGRTTGGDLRQPAGARSSWPPQLPGGPRRGRACAAHSAGQWPLRWRWRTWPGRAACWPASRRCPDGTEVHRQETVHRGQRDELTGLSARYPHSDQDGVPAALDANHAEPLGSIGHRQRQLGGTGRQGPGLTAFKPGVTVLIRGDDAPPRVLARAAMTVAECSAVTHTHVMGSTYSGRHRAAASSSVATTSRSTRIVSAALTGCGTCSCACG